MSSSFFARRAATDQRLLRRSCEALIGLCRGLLADGRLHDEEITFLATWLADNDDISTTWPGEVIFDRVREILSDGSVTQDERDYLLQTLNELVNGGSEPTGATSGLATRLPLDTVDQIIIPEHSFCFTGAFLFGTRAACEKAVTARGGEVTASIRTSLDYLVIGTLASREWAHTSHGRKIEKAIEYKQKGRAISIVSEEQWVRCL